MLNRLFIVIGVLAILVIAAAFVVPRFVQWGDYRGRLEALAGEVLGAEVHITGEIELSLLPQPRMRFTDMIVGPAASPTLAVREVEADFSLVHFFRDQYLVTRLVLEAPQVTLRVDEAGRIDTGIRLPERLSTNISVARAEVIDGSIALNDLRSGDFVGASAISGELRLDALRGPFGFQGQGRFGDEVYSARVSSAALDELGGAQLSVYLQPRSEAFVLSAEGRLSTGLRPAFSGETTFRFKAPRGAAAEDAGRGDFVVAGKLELGPDKALFPALTIVPDENRIGTRLTGLAEIGLGAGRRFNAIIEGAALALPPRDATREQGTQPYELVRLLSEIAPVPVPGLAGTLRVDIGEVGLRALSLRRVRFDANTDGRTWSISDFSAALPGNATLTAEGRLSSDAERRPAFDGTVSVTAPRLDLLSALWRPTEPGSPLFNRGGSLSGRLVLAGKALILSEAVLAIGDSAEDLDLTVDFGPQRSLGLGLKIERLDAADSAALLALLPDAARDAAFGVTFPRGSFALSADRAFLFDLEAKAVDVAGTWDGGVLEFSRLKAEDFGGVAVDASVTAFGTLARPELSGRGTLGIKAATPPALARLHDALGVPQPLRAFLARSLPATLTLELSPPGRDGGQTLAVSGKAGGSDLDLEARLDAGLARALESPIEARVELRSEDVAGLTRQVGLGEAPLLPVGGAMSVVASAHGTPAASLDVNLLAEGGGDMLGLTGTVLLGDLARPRGSGRLEAKLADPSALAGAAGLGGLALPGLAGTAQLSFDGTRALSVTDIALKAAGTTIGGHLAVNDEGRTVTGDLAVGRIEAGGLFGALAGPAALIVSAEGPWPDGPLSAGEAARASSGRVRIAAETIAAGERVLAEHADFDFDWDATSLRLRGLEGRVGAGGVALDLSLCCAGPQGEKRLSGRASLAGVGLDAVAPSVAAAGLSGVADLGVRFEGSGATLPDVLRTMSGDGNFTLRDLRIERFDQNVFSAVADLPDLLQVEPERLAGEVEAKLAGGALTAERVEGGFSIAGGVLRSPNLAIVTPRARLFGSTSLKLPTLGLEGSYALTPVGPVDADGLITEASGGIGVALSGTLAAPAARIDAGPMVDAIMVRALEIEVDRLERLRQEDEARRAAAAAEAATAAAAATAERERAAAEAAARAAAEDEARRAAEASEAARQAELKRQAEEEAARKAAEEQARKDAEARRKAEEEAALRRALDAARRPQDIGFGN